MMGPFNPHSNPEQTRVSGTGRARTLLLERGGGGLCTHDNWWLLSPLPRLPIGPMKGPGSGVKVKSNYFLRRFSRER